MGQEERPDGKRTACIHFPWTLVFSFLLTAACVAVLAFWFGSYDETDRQAYEKLIAGDERITSGFEGNTSKQSRTNLQKNFFFGGEEPRRQLRLHSASSELALEKSGRTIAIIERMQGVEGWMQERLNTVETKETQDILHFTAKEGTYHYIDETLIADKVHFTRFSAEGHDLDLVPDAGVDGQEPEPTLDLVADHAKYSGRTLKLSGSVNGKSAGIEVKADKAAVEGFGAGSEQVGLKGNVDIGFEGHGNLTCYDGEIDLSALTGVFRKGSGDVQAKYIEHLSEGKGKPKLFAVSADQIEGRLIKGSGESPRQSRLAIGSLVGQGNVLIEYGSDVTAQGDRAVFVNDLEQQGKQIAGTVVLTSHQEGNKCSAADGSGNVVDADRIDVDIGKMTSLFQQPKGRLGGHGEAARDVDFSADAMVWDDTAMTLTLTGDVELTQGGVGKLTTDKEASIALHKTDGKKSVRAIDAQGNSILTFIDSGKELEHTLKCYGKIKVDHVKMEAQLHSPKDDEGHIVEGQQVYFQDEKGEAQADRVFIKYEETEKKLSPVRIVLEGNVKIVNKVANSKEENTFSQQYILADRVDYLPQTKEMIFKAEKGRRVLLYDKNNNIEVSAPALKLVRDRVADKESVQSIGGVRLNFVEGELEQLRQHFKFTKQ